eukprot:6203300-Pleurochrysis_carterae.AAC.2
MLGATAHEVVVLCGCICAIRKTHGRTKHARACVRACVRASVHACVRASGNGKEETAAGGGDRRRGESEKEEDGIAEGEVHTERGEGVRSRKKSAK